MVNFEDRLPSVASLRRAAGEIEIFFLGSSIFVFFLFFFYTNNLILRVFFFSSFPFSTLLSRWPDPADGFFFSFFFLLFFFVEFFFYFGESASGPPLIGAARDGGLLLFFLFLKNFSTFIGIFFRSFFFKSRRTGDARKWR